MGDFFRNFWESSGIAQFFEDFAKPNGSWMNLIMLVIAGVLIFLAIKKEFEPYLLLPIAFGMLLVNLPGVRDLVFKEIHEDPNDLTSSVVGYEGLIGYLYYGIKYEIYPCLIFLCLGATTDFGPLIANKKTMLLGAAAQLGVFLTFFLARCITFSPEESASIGIIGGADGPTAILVTSRLAPDLLPAISIAAYSYMALVPVIFPPIIKLLTTKKERMIRMEQARPVSKTEKILFPIVVTVIVLLLVPSAAPLIGCLMLGNLVKESGVVPNIVNTLTNTLMYIVTIILGLCVGATANGQRFLDWHTLAIFGLGIFAFSCSAAGGVLFGKLMCKLTHGKINPMIGAAGVSAVPMAARVVHKMGRDEDPDNYLLMHAMGPNVAGVIGSAVAAGIFLSMFH